MSTNEALLPLPAVMRQTGLSRSKVYKDIKLGIFPRPIKFGADARSMVRWLQSEIAAWVQERIEASRSRVSVTK